ncbi:hypothetical protein [Salinibaculum salinum]|uniref:hypothetical protein n=1 Tax=Salinibaculum salinum TaxID=3131996 RepID=UPI0030EE456D
MTDEREKTASADHQRERGQTGPDTERSVDTAAESFLSVESELRASAGEQVRGQAVDVARVPAETVPEAYPVTIGTSEALALTLELDGRDGTTVTTYFEFDESVADDRLARLLAVHSIPTDRFGDLHGEWILLVIEDGYFLPVVPAEFPRGDSRGVYGILVGLAFNLLVGTVAILGLGNLLSLPVIAAWLLVSTVGLPIVTYLDAWYLRTRTDWGQGPAFWALLAALPGLNVLTVLAYLWTRHRARPLA